MAAKIRRDDEVIVLTGKDKGKRGKVKNVLSSARSLLKVSTWLRNIRSRFRP
ncbi:50S ribosomal protein L24 [Escherichia coli]|uniref:50S ribosomal protein L24 n=1 Tax=Escherichia coli TaxID=562 RepID=A0A376MJG9_ECOLX|nr:50S ribosomal protein L24 [Escherichia coli]